MEFFVSIPGSAAVALVIEVIALMFGKEPNFFILWLVCFAAWWGVYFIDLDGIDF